MSKVDNKSAPNLWTGQLYHFLSLGILVFFTWFIWKQINSPDPYFFWLCIAVPIAHQLFVWITWRLELKSQAISKIIGFKLYLTCFFLLFLSRPLVFIILAWADRGSIGLDLIVQIILGGIFLIPACYTIFSVQKYFGMSRAAGGDHFDTKYRTMPLVKKGMFKYAANSMYVFGFMIFWGIAIVFDSKATLLASAFSHLYIWVHYVTTEKPDMAYLYAHNQN